MGKQHEYITDELATFIRAQPLFFVASAPLAVSGHVNLSPKGLDCLRILSRHSVAYIDVTGSGNETSAHLAENGRITFMFCAFSGPPNILRLYGTGRTILPESDEWHTLSPLFPAIPGARQIIIVNIERVQTACGNTVPLMNLVSQRDTQIRWAEDRGEPGLQTYRQLKNSQSIDGLPTPIGQQFTLEALESPSN